MKVGFIGLGSMGTAMARNLIKAGHTLTVWNRSPEAAEALAREGASRAASPIEAVQGAEAVVSMLANDEALRAVLFADGALGSRGAWLKAPYSDAPGERGQGFWSDDQLRNLMSRAAMDHFQVAVHAIGDRANAEVLDAIDELGQTYRGDRRWRIEHVQVLDPADLPKFEGKGIVAAMQPIHMVSDRKMAEARLGPARLAGAYAWASVQRAGATLAFGSDYPNDDFSPFHGWAAAITRTDAAGLPAGGWQPQERLGREAAWRAYTIDAAYAGFEEDRMGRLAPGQRADFVIVDRDPLTVTPAELRDAKVEETWVGGEKVWDASRRPAAAPLSPRADGDG